MSERLNLFGQPISYAVHNFQVPPRLNFSVLKGNSVLVESISSLHLSDLYKAFSRDSSGKNWTYMPYGPFMTEAEFINWGKRHLL